MTKNRANKIISDIINRLKLKHKIRIRDIKILFAHLNL